MKFKHAALAFISFLTACGVPDPGPFYRTLPVSGAAPGSIISAAPFSPTVKGAAAYRVLYNSRDVHGKPIAVSGVVYVPLAQAPAGGRNIVAWAHPTTGIAAGCAPSVDNGGFLGLTMADSIPGLTDFISAGDIVTATDYEGMGAPGVHPYLIGQAEGQDVIDSVRAARALPGADASGAYVMWGHSQGAQAVMYAAQIAPSYAPELSLAGVAAAAPPSDLNRELTEPFRSTSGRLLAAYVYSTWSRIYDVPITTVVDPRAVANVAAAATKCIGTLPQGASALLAARKLVPVFLSHPPQSTPPWPALFAASSLGGMPISTPALIVQGTKDPTVEPHYTETYAALLCRQHAVLQFDELPGITHLTVAYKSLPIVTAWIAARFAGAKPPDNCKT